MLVDLRKLTLGNLVVYQKNKIDGKIRLSLLLLNNLALCV